jgi:hypothetical protein
LIFWLLQAAVAVDGKLVVVEARVDTEPAMEHLGVERQQNLNCHLLWGRLTPLRLALERPAEQVARCLQMDQILCWHR